MSRQVLMGYFIALHILLIIGTAIIVRSHLHGEPSNILEQHLNNMLAFQRWADPQVPANAVIFLGDSITQGLATAAVTPYSVNYGIGGENTAQLLAALPSYQSLAHVSTIVLEIGINDYIQGIQDGIIDRYRNIVAVLPKENTLFWNAILPVRQDIVRLMDLIDTNRIIKTLCEERKNCFYIDTWKFLTDKEGNIISEYFLDDGIHLSVKGYQQWILALQSALEHRPS